ncbi:MAG: hypothetical protein ABII74_04570 [Elusimicrobiota bacterium]
MKRLLFGVLISFILGLSCLFAEEAKDNLPDVSIQGEAKDKIEIKKSTPGIELNLPEIVDPSLEKTEELLKKTVPSPRKEDYEQFGELNSQQTASPWLEDVPQPPLIVFNPEKTQAKIIRWKLIINDEQGNIIRTIEGKGYPVRGIVWEGINDKKDFIKVGSLYSYKFVGFDAAGNSQTAMGEPFRLDWLRYEKKGKIFLEIYNPLLYTQNDISFLPSAKAKLKRIVDLLRENSRYAFQIEFYTDEKDLAIINRQKELLKNYLTEQLIVLPEDILVKIYNKTDDRGPVTRFVIYR